MRRSGGRRFVSMLRFFPEQWTRCFGACWCSPCAAWPGGRSHVLDFGGEDEPMEPEQFDVTIARLLGRDDVMMGPGEVDAEIVRLSVPAPVADDREET